MTLNKNIDGRLSQSLDPVAVAIIANKQPRNFLLNELAILADLNEAHLISLYHSDILPISQVKPVLKLINKLRKDNFSVLLDKPCDRGSYILFENYLIETLDINIAGSIHLGRSRNDINAAICKLNLFYLCQKVYKNLCSLRATLIKQANKYLKVAMPIYSQFQVAQVGTYAYYLLGIEEAISRDQYYFKTLFDFLDECPLGSGAGCGTSFSINTKLIASLLGFSRVSKHALDAVASRDLVLRALSNFAIIGTTLCRMAQDYQLWTTQEFSFFDLPDSLCGASSMMPQKRNPYLLEIIKGKSASLTGILMQALTAMHNVPFSNSIEISTHAVQGIDVASNTLNDIITLSQLFVSKVKPLNIQMKKSIHKGVACATGVTETLVKQTNIPFRKAHHTVGSKITSALKNNIDPNDEILGLLKNKFKIKDTISWAHLNEYGGGPGKNGTKKIYLSANRRLNKDIRWVEFIEKQWHTAKSKCQSMANKIIKGDD